MAVNQGRSDRVIFAKMMGFSNDHESATIGVIFDVSDDDSQVLIRI